jgi:transcriptional regulator with XRE-family HTH domain
MDGNKPNGPKIRELRKKRDLSQRALADLLGVEGATVSQWELEKNGITVEHLKKLAAELRATTDDLVRNESESDLELNSSVTLIDNYEPFPVPLVPLGGLTVRNLVSRKQDATLRRDFALSDEALSAEAVAFKITDRSMAPLYNVGEPVIVDKLPFEPGEHIVAHIKSKNATVFRVFEYDGPDHCQLVPLNPQYQVLRFTNAEFESDVDVIGVMVHHGRKRQKSHT